MAKNCAPGTKKGKDAPKPPKAFEAASKPKGGKK